MPNNITKMAYQSFNKYKVFFSDGSSFESSGSASSEVKNLSINEEFKWVSYHISKEILSLGKKVKDVVKIDYTLSALTDEMLLFRTTNK